MDPTNRLQMSWKTACTLGSSTLVLPSGRIDMCRMEGFSIGTLSFLSWSLLSMSTTLRKRIRFSWLDAETANYQIKCTRMGIKISSILISALQSSTRWRKNSHIWFGKWWTLLIWHTKTDSSMLSWIRALLTLLFQANVSRFARICWRKAWEWLKSQAKSSSLHMGRLKEEGKYLKMLFHLMSMITINAALSWTTWVQWSISCDLTCQDSSSAIFSSSSRLSLRQWENLLS